MSALDVPESVPVGPLPESFELDRLSPPLQWVTAANGTGMWLVTDYTLSREVLADPRFRRDEASAPDAPNPAAYSPAPGSIISVDGAEHALLRGLIAPAFTERRTARLRPFTEDLVDRLLDGLTAQDKPADFVAHVSNPLPFLLLCHLLGIPPEDREIFGTWVNLLFRMEGDHADHRRHSVSLARYMRQLVAAKRNAPGTDLISDLIEAAAAKEGVTDRHLVTLCLSLLMAGYDSTADQVTLCVLTLLRNPGLMSALRRDPELVSRATEELLRLNPAPYTTFGRMTVEPVTIAGTTVKPGELVVVYTMAANRDASVYPAAGEIDLDRKRQAHLAFGHGVHRCVGAPLARLQITVLLDALVRRLPGLTLAEDPGRLDWRTGTTTRGLRRMNVTWPD